MEITNNGILRKFANYYEDFPPTQISHVPVVDLAYISNNNGNIENKGVSNYNFNIIHLSYSDFKICFFDSILENFNISPANFEVQALSFHQNYVDTTNKQQAFQLNNAILYAWAEKNQSTISALPMNKKILLNKNSLMTRSIGSFRNVQNALSWNEAIQTLLESGEIIPVEKDKLCCALVDFNIFVQYFYDSLEVSVNMQFTYRVYVPGYKNKPETNPCYTNDLSLPRKNFQFTNYGEIKNNNNLTYNDDASIGTGADPNENNFKQPFVENIRETPLTHNFQEFNVDNTNHQDDNFTLKDEIESMVEQSLAESAEQQW